jgi:bifunctional ADP-heptose synthase (sugar kinase/adenylyltransferase)
VSACEVSWLRREQEERIKDLQAQAGRALRLEAELAKAKEAELTLWQEFEQRLTEDKKVLAVKYDAEVDELHAAQDTENKKRDAKVQELMDCRESDFEKYDAKLGM